MYFLLSFRTLILVVVCVSGMNDEQLGEDSVAYMSHFDQIDMGIEFPPYEDPPPPYTPVKPPDLPPGEAPPPYEPPGNNNDNDVGTNGYGPLSGRGHPAQAANRFPGVHAGHRMLPNSFAMWGNPALWGNAAMFPPVCNDPRAIPLQDLAPLDDGSSGYVAFEPASEVNQLGDNSGSPDGYGLTVTLAALPLEDHSIETDAGAAATQTLAEDTDTIKKPTHSPLIKKSKSIEIRNGNCVPRTGYEAAEEAMTSEECLMSCTNTDTSAASLDNLFGSTQPSPSSWDNPSTGSIPTSNPSSVSSQNYSSPSAGHSQDLSLMAAVASLAEPLSPTVVGDMALCCSSNQPQPLSTPSSACTSFSSPESPVNPNFFPFGRSSSMNSQFSVCSETGERRSPRGPLGVVSGDKKYPAVGFSGRNPLPAVAANNAALASNGNSSLSPRDTEPTGSAATSPPTNSPPLIAYVDHNDNMSSSRLPALPVATGNSRPTNGYGKAKTKSKPANKDKTSPRGSRSPRVKRSSPKAANTSYKEYGFIDDLSQTSPKLPHSGQASRKPAQPKATKSSRPARSADKPAIDSDSLVNNPPSSCNEDAIDRDFDRSDRNKKNSNYLNSQLRKKSSDSGPVMNGKSRNGISLKSQGNDGSLSEQVDNQKKKSRASRSGRKEQRTSERDPQQASVSLDRKRKRPFASSRHVPQPEVFLEAIITPGQEKTVASDVRTDVSNGRRNKAVKRPVKRISRDKPHLGDVIVEKSSFVAR